MGAMPVRPSDTIHGITTSVKNLRKMTAGLSGSLGFFEEFAEESEAEFIRFLGIP